MEPVSILLAHLLFFILTHFDFYPLFMNDRRFFFCVQHGVDLSVVVTKQRKQLFIVSNFISGLHFMLFHTTDGWFDDDFLQFRRLSFGDGWLI
jgi:hypothetical protein